MDFFFTLCFGLGFGIIVVGAVGIAAYVLYNRAQPTLTRKAKIVGKRISMPSAGPRQVYYCTFEFADGQREEYSVAQEQYGLFAEDDQGELDTKGVLFWEFRRALR